MGAIGMTRVRKPRDAGKLSAAEWVRQQLIDDIVAGRLLPGEKLCEVKIALRLGCSRTPVREAFRHLGALGLANFEKNRGGNVVQLERALMQELFQALAELAAACAGLAAMQGEDLRRALLERDWPMAALPAATGNDDDVLATVFRLSGNRLLAESGTAMRCRLLPYWRLIGKAADDWSMKAVKGQNEAIRAILAGESSTARRVMRAFVLSARDHAVQGLPESVLP
jgi:DNA-binding GntR family transcriptional regulator